MKQGTIPVPNDAPDWLSNVIQNTMGWVQALRRGPQPLTSYVVSGLPSPAKFPNNQIYVSNESGGAVPAFSDGTNWRRVTDRAIVS